MNRRDALKSLVTLPLAASTVERTAPLVVAAQPGTYTESKGTAFYPGGVYTFTSYGEYRKAWPSPLDLDKALRWP